MAEYSSLNWTTNDGIDIKGYHGTSANPKAVLAVVHGVGEHSERYKHLAEFITQNGYAFAAYDHRGHGQSTGKRGHTRHYKALSDDIGTFLEKIRAFYPGLPIFLYGHSMGGNIVLDYYVRHTDAQLQGIVTTGAFIKLAFEPSAFIVGLGRVMRNILPGFSQSNQLVLEHISRSPEVVEAYKNDPLVHNRLTASLGIGMIETAKKLYTHNGKTTIPMLLMHGGADKLVSKKGSKRFAENMSGDVTYKEWPGLYHEIHNEPEQQEVFEYLLAWLEARL